MFALFEVKNDEKRRAQEPKPGLRGQARQLSSANVDRPSRAFRLSPDEMKAVVSKSRAELVQQEKLWQTRTQLEGGVQQALALLAKIDEAVHRLASMG